MRRLVILALFVVATAGRAAGQSTTNTYAAIMMRAAPGHLLELIDLMKSRQPVYQAAGEPQPLMLRHSQGDHWDLMILAPINDLSDYFSRDRAARWQSAARRHGFDELTFNRKIDEWVAWREELYVTGPPVVALHSAAADAGYFHLEVFQALAGKRDSLMVQREMENDFLTRIGRPANFIFHRIAGAAWDVFTIGLYRDLQHYAEPTNVSPDAENAAATTAGFQSRAHIGAYLRRFLAGHHDTLGSLVK